VKSKRISMLQMICSVSPVSRRAPDVQKLHSSGTNSKAKT